MCLKIENCCLKFFMEIRVGEKVCGIRKILFKNWKLLFGNTHQTPPSIFIIFIQLIYTWPPLRWYILYSACMPGTGYTKSPSEASCCLLKRNLFKKKKKNLVSSSNSFNSLTRGPPRGGISCTRHICRVQDIQNPLGTPHAFVKEKSLPKEKKTKI